MNAQWSIASGEDNAISTGDHTDVTKDNKEGGLFIPPSSWIPFHTHSIFHKLKQER